MKNRYLYLIFFVFALSVLSCTEKSNVKYMHDFAGAWEIESIEFYDINAEGNGFNKTDDVSNAGYIELFDNMDDIGSSNICFYELYDSIACESVIRMNNWSIPAGRNFCYWYAGDNNRVTFWNTLMDLSYIYSTYTVEQKSANKQIWTFYYYRDTVNYFGPYSANKKEVYSLKRTKK